MKAPTNWPFPTYLGRPLPKRRPTKAPAPTFPPAPY